MTLVRWVGRGIGLDVHRDFCVIAICEDGKVRPGGRVPSTPEGLATLAESLLPSDRVALEVTGSCWEVLGLAGPGFLRRKKQGLPRAIVCAAGLGNKVAMLPSLQRAGRGCGASRGGGIELESERPSCWITRRGARDCIRGQRAHRRVSPGIPGDSRS